MTLPEIKRAIEKLPRRSRRQIQTYLFKLNCWPKSTARRKTARKSKSLKPACLAANQDPALAKEIESLHS